MNQSRIAKGKDKIRLALIISWMTTLGYFEPAHSQNIQSQAKIVPRSIIHDEPSKKIAARRSFCDEQKKKYQPYLEIGAGGIEYSDKKAQAFTVYDLFIPWSIGDKNTLSFLDLKVLDRIDGLVMGSAQIGYRHLLLTKEGFNQLLGFYASFDRIRSNHGEYFKQLVFGGEYWLNDWFIGGNFYLPIGVKKRLFEETSAYSKYETTMRGTEAQIGYVIANGLTGYVGGFYFNGNDGDSLKGINVKLEYLFYQGSEKRFLRIFDSAKLVTGVKKIFSGGLMGFIELKIDLSVGSCSKNNLPKFEAHMVDLIRRLPPMVTIVDPPKASATTTDSSNRRLWGNPSSEKKRAPSLTPPHPLYSRDEPRPSGPNEQYEFVIPCSKSDHQLPNNI